MMPRTPSVAYPPFFSLLLASLVALFDPGVTWATIMALLENPTNEQAVSGVALIRGWAFDTQEDVQISTVELFIDSALVGNVPCCSERGDVKDAFPQFSTQNTNNSGWGITFNWGLLTPGVHTVRVEIQNTAGQSLSTETRQVTVLKPGEYEFLDQFSLAKATAKVEGDELVINRITVRDKATQQQQEVDARFRWTEGTQALELTTVVTRLGTLPSQALFSPLTPDPRVELLVATEQASSQVFAVFESPQEGEAVSGVTLIRGWAFAQESDASIRQVLLSIDGEVPTTVPCCSRRQDVADAYPSSPHALVSGWGITFNFGRLNAGFHTLQIQIEDSAGAMVTVAHRVQIVRPGDVEFLDQFDLSKATARVAGGGISLAGVLVRDKATQQLKTVDMRVRWFVGSQALGIASSPMFLFAPGVSTQEQQIFRDAMTMTILFFEEYFRVDVGNVAIFANADLDGIVDDYLQWHHIHPEHRDPIRQRWQNQVGESGFHNIFIYTGNPSWISAPTGERIEVIVHECFHVLQNELTGSPGIIREPIEQVPFGGPRWFIEGSALYMQRRVSVDNGFYTFSEAKAGLVDSARATSASLQSMETWIGILAAGPVMSYALGFFAVDLLVTTSSFDIQALPAFWNAIGHGLTWQDAFQQVSGRNIETFYSEFEAYRHEQFPELPYISGRVTNTSGTPLAGIHVYACPTIPGSCGYAKTAADGIYSIAVPAGNYLVQFGFTSDGNHPAGFYSTKGFTPDSSKASIIAVTGSDVNGINVSIPAAS